LSNFLFSAQTASYPAVVLIVFGNAFGLIDGVCLIGFAFAYLESPRVPKWARSTWLWLGLATSLWLLAVIRPSLQYDWSPLLSYANVSDWPSTVRIVDGPLDTLDTLLDFAWVIVPFLLLRDAVRERPRRHWASSVLLAAGILAPFAYFGITNAATLLAGTNNASVASPWALPSIIFFELHSALVPIVAAYALVRAIRPKSEKTPLLIACAATVTAAVTLGVVSAVANLSPDSNTAFTTNWWIVNLSTGLVFLPMPALAAYALLRHRLLGIDLKIKWTLKRGTLVAIILGAFFVATAVAEQYLQGYGFVFGGVAIGLLLFAIRPIERAIDRMADRAMPKTTGTPEYLAQRRHEIYRAALEDSLADGAVTAKERAVLVRLAANLGIDGNDAMRIEGEVLAGRAA
jgi:hypothetical protein